MPNLIPKRVWWQQILVLVAISISYIQLAGVIGTQIVVPRSGWFYGVRAVGDLGDLAVADTIAGRFARWDSEYYLRIARQGYRPDGGEIAYFPLYPMAIRGLSTLSGLSLLWSGWLLSIVSFAGACLFLYRWVLLDHEPRLAMWSVTWLCVFPMTFFFVSLYAEALFLLLSIASAYYARRGQFLASGIAIALAGATRPTAFLLAVPFLVEFWQQKNWRGIQLANVGLGALIAPLGVLGYAGFLSLASPNLNVLSVYTSNLTARWETYITWPWVTLYDGIQAAVFETGITSDWFSQAIARPDLAYAFFGMAAAVYSLFRVRLSTALFLLVSMVLFYSNHGPKSNAFVSIPRHVAGLFPIYLVLALVTVKLPKPFQGLLSRASLILLGILSAFFASGGWIA